MAKLTLRAKPTLNPWAPVFNPTAPLEPSTLNLISTSNKLPETKHSVEDTPPLILSDVPDTETVVNRESPHDTNVPQSTDLHTKAENQNSPPGIQRKPNDEQVASDYKLKTPPNNAQEERCSSLGSLVDVKEPKASPCPPSILEDDTHSMMSFGLSGETVRAIDLDNAYLPYPTLRTILKEARRILKSALYEFMKRYLPEKLSEKAFEFPDNSSLSQLILSIRDIVKKIDSHKFPQETRDKLNQLRDIDSKANHFNNANELYDLVSRRQNISTAELCRLLANLSGLINAIGVPDLAHKQYILHKYATTLAVDIEKKLERIQSPTRSILQKINDQREALATEEAMVTEKYRHNEKDIQRSFMVDAESLRKILLDGGNSAPEHTEVKSTTPRLPPGQPIAAKEQNSPSPKDASLSTLPDICVWDPQKQLIDYRPAGTQPDPDSEHNKPIATRHPWDIDSITHALKTLSSKENLCRGEKDTQSNGSKTVGGAEFPFSKHVLEVVVPSRHNNAIPIKKTEESDREPGDMTQKPKSCKAEPMPKHNPYETSPLENTREFDLLIDL
ncbi:hypothetical protein TWF730_007288 [Orbilia blumenaviensis]|uniref:Uncharacterized protein n=1 Tax=Orbilia blumenaviensis TaxID=1796055 RepID=A0AAV9V7A0_9PEZI